MEELFYKIAILAACGVWYWMGFEAGERYGRGKGRKQRLGERHE